MRGDKGMTLMELLVVISILGLLVTVMLPFQGRMADNTKREETIQLLESIRFGLLGAENAYDANGNRVLGGYVGDYGTLPDFVVHEWDTADGWIIPEHADASKANEPDVLDWTVAASQNYHDASLMPLNLWINTVRVEGVTVPHDFMDHADWNGPYVVAPRDDFSSDDDLFVYNSSPSSPAEIDESRHFLLRQGEGRLTDGWGSAIHIYFDDKKNLYFVSAGSDRRINFGAETTPPTDLGPADLTLQHNDDNLVLMISHEQWNLNDQKIVTTKQQLKDLKSALLGRQGKVTDGVYQPNGYIADMGSMETLMGSHILEGGTVYKCVETHTPTASSFSTSSEWEEVAGGSTGKPITDYPLAFTWSTGRQYHAAKTHLIAFSGDYVKVETPPSSGEYKYYRCIEDNTATSQSPTNNPDMWVEDDTFKDHSWVPVYDPGTLYKQSAAPAWSYYKNIGFGVGWRGPYTTYSDTPLTDAWGREISLEFDSAENILLRSKGPDDDPAQTDDDIIETIQRSDYAVPTTVTVKAGTSITTQTDDFVAIFTAFNGEVAYIAAKNQATTVGLGNDAFFEFTSSDLESIAPENITDGTVDIASTSSTATLYTPSAVWLPMGRVTVVYQNGTTGAYTARFQESFILHSGTNPTLILGD